MKLTGRIALITGASKGIGRAVARRFAEEGAHVIGIARSKTKLEELDDELKALGKEATFSVLDLSDFDKIDELAAHISNRFGKLDILVGNAGVLGGLSPVSHYDHKVWQKVIDINLTANWRLIKAFDGLLKTSDNGRVLFVTSGLATNTLPYWAPYSASKAALEMLVKTYAAENKISKVKANLVNPGTVKTEMYDQAFPGDKSDHLPKPQEVTDVFVKLASANLKESGAVFNV